MRQVVFNFTNNFKLVSKVDALNKAWIGPSPQWAPRVVGKTGDRQFIVIQDALLWVQEGEETALIAFPALDSEFMSK